MSIVDELYTKIENGREGKNIGLSTGLPKLDYYTGGFKKGVYKLVFSKSSVGKTSFVIYTDIYNILKNYPDKKILICYFSLEIGASTLLAKILSLYLWEEFGVELTYMQLLSFSKKLPDDIYEYVIKAKAWLESISSKFIIIDKQLNADSFYAAMMELHKTHGVFSKSEDGKRSFYTPNDPELIINVVVDHLLLVSPQKGRTKKEEMDLISTYCVRFRELCQTSFDIIMQENRNAGTVDRRKMELQEPTVDDIQQTSEPLQAADICIALFSPFRNQLKSYRSYRIYNDEDTGDKGLEDVGRAAIILKNRYGISNKVVPMAFMGSVGKFEELPKPEDVDYTKYQSWKEEKKKTNTESKEEEISNVKKYSF